MQRNLVSGLGLVLLAVSFFVFTLLNNALFSSVRVDLTENKLYTLAPGTRAILEKIDEPVSLYFFFSEKASEDLTSLRAYATRVRELLEEYERLAGGKLQLSVIDPAPFSDAEDQAAAFGLQAIPVNSAGDELYFGLAGSNALDGQAVISFFQPDKEAFLEYEISQLIQGLLVNSKPVVGLLSTLPVQGDMDMSTYQMTPSWMAVGQLEQRFDVATIEPTADALPENLDLLMLVHPHGLSESLLRDIDQFALKGGRLLVFVDPLAESARPLPAGPGAPPGPATSASVLPLLASWGLTLQEGKVLGDAQHALTVSNSQGQPVRHMAILGFQPENFNREDVILASLESINLSTAGILALSESPTTRIETLIASSDYAMPYDSVRLQMLNDPMALQRDFQPTAQEYSVAVRVTGMADATYQPADAGEAMDAKADAGYRESGEVNIIVVADTDLLSDRLWVQVQDFFGEQIASPWADNGSFVANAVENLAGSADLISIRSRGRFSRPFTVVQALRRTAEADYLASANDLQAQLAETEAQLSQLEASRDEQNLLGLSPEQEAALTRFQDEKLRIRKQLRDVRHQLDRDIEALGTQLKFINIALVPLLLTLLLLAFNYVRLRRRIVGERHE